MSSWMPSIWRFANRDRVAALDDDKVPVTTCLANPDWWEDGRKELQTYFRTPSPTPSCRNHMRNTEKSTDLTHNDTQTLCVLSEQRGSADTFDNNASRLKPLQQGCSPQTNDVHFQHRKHLYDVYLNKHMIHSSPPPFMSDDVSNAKDETPSRMPESTLVPSAFRVSNTSVYDEHKHDTISEGLPESDYTGAPLSLFAEGHPSSSHVEVISSDSIREADLDTSRRGGVVDTSFEDSPSSRFRPHRRSLVPLNVSDEDLDVVDEDDDPAHFALSSESHSSTTNASTRPVEQRLSGLVMPPFPYPDHAGFPPFPYHSAISQPQAIEPHCSTPRSSSHHQNALFATTDSSGTPREEWQSDHSTLPTGVATDEGDIEAKHYDREVEIHHPQSLPTTSGTPDVASPLTDSHREPSHDSKTVVQGHDMMVLEARASLNTEDPNHHDYVSSDSKRALSLYQPDKTAVVESSRRTFEHPDNNEEQDESQNGTSMLHVPKKRKGAAGISSQYSPTKRQRLFAPDQANITVPNHLDPDIVILHSATPTDDIDMQVDELAGGHDVSFRPASRTTKAPKQHNTRRRGPTDSLGRKKLGEIVASKKATDNIPVYVPSVPKNDVEVIVSPTTTSTPLPKSSVESTKHATSTDPIKKSTPFTFTPTPSLSLHTIEARATPSSLFVSGTAMPHSFVDGAKAKERWLSSRSRETLSRELANLAPNHGWDSAPVDIPSARQSMRTTSPTATRLSEARNMSTSKSRTSLSASPVRTSPSVSPKRAVKIPTPEMSTAPTSTPGSSLPEKRKVSSRSSMSYRELASLAPNKGYDQAPADVSGRRITRASAADAPVSRLSSISSLTSVSAASARAFSPEKGVPHLSPYSNKLESASKTGIVDKIMNKLEGGEEDDEGAAEQDEASGSDVSWDDKSTANRHLPIISASLASQAVVKKQPTQSPYFTQLTPSQISQKGWATRKGKAEAAATATAGAVFTKSSAADLVLEENKDVAKEKDKAKQSKIPVKHTVKKKVVEKGEIIPKVFSSGRKTPKMLAELGPEAENASKSPLHTRKRASSSLSSDPRPGPVTTVAKDQSSNAPKKKKVQNKTDSEKVERKGKGAVEPNETASHNLRALPRRTSSGPPCIFVARNAGLTTSAEAEQKVQMQGGRKAQTSESAPNQGVNKALEKRKADKLKNSGRAR